MEKPRILITGSSGTVGTRLCEKLLEIGYPIIGVDKKPNKWNTKIDDLTQKIDLEKKEELKNLPTNVDVVIHLAANARVYELVKNPELANENWQCLFNTLEFCRESNIPRFIFSSSREVYGNSEQTRHNEDDVYIQKCESPYTASKLGGETLVHSYHQCYGINYTILRFSNVYGMYDDSDRVIPKFIRLINDENDIVVYGKEKVLDFTYIDDTVDGIIKSIEDPDMSLNDTFNIASGTGVYIYELAEFIKSYMNKDINVILKQNRTGEVMKFIADISKAKNKLGYEPKINFNDGMKLTLDWYYKNIL